MKIDFLGQTGQGRSTAVDSQLTMNMYPELRGGSAKGQVILIGTPGLQLYCTDATNSGACRGFYVSGSNRFFAVIGNKFIEIVGTTQTSRGNLKTLVGQVTIAENVNLSANTTQIMIADGSYGYIFTLETNTFANITSADYAAGSHVVYKDGYFVQNKSGTNTFIFSGLYDGTSWNAVDYYAAEGNADDILALGKVNNELWVFGGKSIEIWDSTGDSNNPFARVQSAFIDIGIGAVNSIGTINNTIFWIGSNAQGNRVIWMASGYIPQRISDHSIEYLLGQISDISDAVGFCYQQEGHYFYQLSFSNGNKTIVYDMATGLWHQRGAYNSTTGENDKHRGICSAYWDNKVMVGDYDNSNIYYYDLACYTDNGNTIKRIRQGGHISQEGKNLFFNTFELDIERGVGLISGQGSDPQIMLQYSNDGGYTWSNEMWVSAGKLGERFARARWLRLGMARDRVFRVTMTDPVKWILIGAYAEIEAE